MIGAAVANPAAGAGLTVIVLVAEAEQEVDGKVTLTSLPMRGFQGVRVRVWVLMAAHFVQATN